MKLTSVFDLPDNPDTRVAYELLPKDSGGDFYKERTDRNIGWITREEQEILKRSKIGVAGCGGMGAQLAEKFLRLGIGEIRIADIENFDASNINRQFAAGKNTVGKNKAFATARMMRDISDDFTLRVYPQGICRETVEDFTGGLDLICDEIEFWAVGARILLHNRARALDVPVMNCNTVGFGARLFLFTPQSATMEDLLGFTLEEAEAFEGAIRAKTATREMVARVMKNVIGGLIPEPPSYFSGNLESVQNRLFTEGKASIIATNPPLSTGLVADRALFHLLKNSGIRRTIEETPEMPGYIYFDAATMVTKIVRGRWWQHET